MNQELTVEVTEFDNLRTEYMQYEAAGEDYIPVKPMVSAAFSFEAQK